MLNMETTVVKMKVTLYVLLQMKQMSILFYVVRLVVVYMYSILA